MIIDAHHHLWRLDGGYGWLDEPAMAPIRRDYTVSDLRGHLAATGVDRTVLVEAARCDTAESIEFLALAAETPEIAGVVAWLDFAALADPTAAGASTDPAAIAALAAIPGAAPPSSQLLKSWSYERPAKLVGVRDQVQAHADPRWLARPEVVAGLRRISELGLVVDLVVRPDQLAGAGVAADGVPLGRFVLDHLGKPPLAAGGAGLASWRDEVARLAERPNVVAKLSGLVTEADWARWTDDDLAPVVAHALAVFGPQRLLWGSDWPVAELATDAVRWLATARALVPSQDHDAVFGGNAARTYQLEID
ncbi:L-fuconolactonase [Allocatelliglobosispora scoriae]|uniref:L-fuconolactonase n=1 Tax=Allocatelliglobosispora scoriae TaxID=643052 RepID=A0A841BRX5_9ACTN|nr:amidohydrolase family protein [Allocatelliglobosispora scoriae]MBB5869561.1 L-fuconolactonase [Allocatelliglobosispora scoriae]